MGGARTRVRVRARDRRRRRRAGQLAAHGDHGPRFSAHRALHGADRSLGVFRARTADFPQADAHARGRGDGGPSRLVVAGVALGQPLRRRLRTRGRRRRVDRLGDRLDLRDPLPVFVIAPLRGQVGRLAPLGDAIKSDTLSVLSFEVGLFGWMALAQYVIWKAPIDRSSHWFLMQIGMMLGFLTSWPVNRWLLTKGVKEPMMAAGRTPIPAPMVAA